MNYNTIEHNSSLFNEFVCKLGIFWHEWVMTHECQKKAQFTRERVEYNVFLFDEPLKGSKSLKIFKISLTLACDIYQNPFTQEKILKI
jgi:hypothetical protein